MTDSVNHSCTTPKNPKSLAAENSPGLLTRLPGILRLLGSLTVLGSLYFFFMKGWEGSSDLTRYLMLFGHTVALVLLALASNRWLRESKGARLLLVLSMVSTVANFSILGSFLYAEFGIPVGSGFVSSMRWSLDNTWLTCGLVLTAPLLLLPAVILSFRVLARDASGNMITLFMVSNLVLLLPVREPMTVALMALALSLYTLMFNIRSQRQRLEARTLEGSIALALQFLPVATLLVRNLWLHGGADILAMSAAIITFITLRQLATYLSHYNWLQALCDLISIPVSLTASGYLLTALIHFSGSEATAVAAGCLLAGAMLYELSLRSHRFNRTGRLVTAISLAALLTLNMWAFGGWIAHLALLAAGGAMIHISCTHKQRLLLLLGIIMTLVTIAHSSAQLWATFDINAWLLSAALGMLAIISASLLEARGEQLKRAYANYRMKFRHWAY